MSLKTDYKDDILAVGNLRKYQMIQNNDGTVSFQDVTQYEQTGDVFGAGDINRTNQAVNEKFDSGDVVDPMLTTEPGFAADAYQTKLQFDEQNKNLYNGKFLDFSNSEVISPSSTTPSKGSSTITVPKDGFCFMYHQIGHNGTGDVKILINDVEVASDYASGSYQRVNISMPLKQGTVVTFKNDGNVHSYTKLVVVPFLE